MSTRIDQMLSDILRFKDGSGTVYKVIGVTTQYLVTPEEGGRPTIISEQQFRELRQLMPCAPAQSEISKEGKPE